MGKPPRLAEYHVRIQDHLVSQRGVGLYLVRYDVAGGRQWIAEPTMLKWKPFSECEFFKEPSLVLDHEVLPRLAQELVRIGILKEEPFGNAAELAAAKEHLSSLKQVSDRLLGIVEKQPWKSFQEPAKEE